VEEVLDLQIEEKIKKTKITFLKVIGIVTRKDLINNFIIEDLWSNKEAMKMHLIDLFQQLEEGKYTMNQIILEGELETIIWIKKNLKILGMKVMELIIKMEGTSIKNIMTKSLRSLVTIRDMVNNHLVMQITMKKNIFITIIIIKMNTTKIYKKESFKNMKWFLQTEELTMNINKQL